MFNRKSINNFAALIKSGYEILDFSDCNLKNEMYQSIALQRKHVLGRGSYGNVYLAYPINKETSELIKDKMLAVKIYKNTSSVREREAKFSDAYYGACELIRSGEDFYMVMPCLPGHDLMVSQDHILTLNPEFAEFDFPHRVDMVCNIMMAINLIHHHTPRTGCALVHGDINGSNVRVYYDAASDVFDAYVIDFGCAKEIEDNPDKVQMAEMNGTALFMPNEIVEHEVRGVKSDIYSLTPLFAAIFGADNPFSQRSKIFWGYAEYFKIPYDFRGMFDGYTISDYPCDIKAVIEKFLNRMQSEAIQDRPDSDEALKFFTTLNMLCKSFEVDPSHPDIGVCAAKLVMMAEGLWSREDVDDPEKQPVAEAIVKAAGGTPLSSPLVKKIISSENFFLMRSRDAEKQADEMEEEKGSRLSP